MRDFGWWMFSVAVGLMIGLELGALLGAIK